MLMGSIAMMAVVSLASCSANSDFDNTNTTDPNTKGRYSHRLSLERILRKVRIRVQGRLRLHPL